MIKLILLSCVFVVALAAPPADSSVLRADSSKLSPDMYILRKARQTPASTAKLTPIVSPIVSPIAHIPYVSAPIVPHVSPYAYAYSAPIAPVAYVPGSYSIEQHGYNIAY